MTIEQKNVGAALKTLDREDAIAKDKEGQRVLLKRRCVDAMAVGGFVLACADASADKHMRIIGHGATGIVLMSVIVWLLFNILEMFDWFRGGDRAARRAKLVAHQMFLYYEKRDSAGYTRLPLPMPDSEIDHLDPHEERAEPVEPGPALADCPHPSDPPAHKP
jgi:hypothetical protein